MFIYNTRQLEIAIRKGITISYKSIYIIIRENIIRSICVIGVALLIGLVICFSLPKEYRSSIQISLEESSSPVNTGSSLNFDFLNSTYKDAVRVEAYPDLILNTSAIETISEFVLPLSNEDITVKEKTLRDIINKNTVRPWWRRIGDFMVSPFCSNDDKEEYLINEISRRILVSSGKSKNILIVETIMQDPLTAAILCDSIVNFLNYKLEEYNKQNLYVKLSFLQDQFENKKSSYYEAKYAAAKFMDNHKGKVIEQERVIGEYLSREAKIKFDAYLNSYKELIIAKFAYAQPQNRFFVLIPAHVAVKPMWPKKMAIIFIFGAQAILLVIISATIKVVLQEIKRDADDK